MASLALSSLRPAAPGTPQLLFGLNTTSLRGSCFPSFPRHNESKGSLSLSTAIPGKRGPWRTAASRFPFLKKKKKNTNALKEELLEAIAPLDRGAEATEEDQKRVDQEAKGSEWWSGETVAVVTGANRGIGLEVCRQLADKGLTVIMTARQRQEQLSSPAKHFLQEAAEMERKNVIFHTLDIGQEQNVLDFVKWLELHVGNIDILVNNAAMQTAEVDWGFLKQKHIDIRTFLGTPDCGRGTSESHELAEECIHTNYHGTKMLTNALLPLLRPSPYKARIVMVSSVAGLLYYLRDEELRNQLSEVEDLTEQKIDGVLNLFLEDLKSEKGMEKWPLKLPAYSTSKAAMNAYTRLLAIKLKAIACVNSVHPGVVRTNITEHAGNLSAAQGAENVLRVALFPVGGPSGHNFLEGEDSEF